MLTFHHHGATRQCQGTGYPRPERRGLAPAKRPVIGAGAVGGTIGGRLFSSGHEVVLAARLSWLDGLARPRARQRVVRGGTAAVPPGAPAKAGARHPPRPWPQTRASPTPCAACQPRD